MDQNEVDFEAFFSRVTEREANDEHPDRDALEDLLLGILDSDTAAAISAHVVTCERCSEELASVRNEMEKFAETLSDQTLDELRNARRKREIYRLTSDFLAQHFPKDADYFKRLWQVIKDYPLSRIGQYLSPEPQAGMALGFGEREQMSSEATAAINTITALMIEEGIESPAELPAEKLERVISEVADRKKLPNHVTAELHRHLSHL